MRPPGRLSQSGLADATRELAQRHRKLRHLVARNGVPPLWLRPEGFATLVKMILEQQVSLASAAAAYRNLEARLGAVEPERFLLLDDGELLAAGFSRQKTSYCRGLAEGLLDDSIVLDDLSAEPDDAARRRLTAVRGIGPWTADVYLMFALGRPDVWPPGDRALLVSLGRLLDTEPPPSHDAEAYATRWAPWRSVAARLLWHDYLGGVSPRW